MSIPCPNGATVLLVEDESLVRMMGTLIFSDAGFQVLDFDNADDALALLQGGATVHLLFTDIHVPGWINGLALAHRVYSRWPDIGIIVVSGQMPPRTHELPPGARFHSKPYNGKMVIQHAHELLAPRIHQINDRPAPI